MKKSIDWKRVALTAGAMLGIIVLSVLCYELGWLLLVKVGKFEITSFFDHGVLWLGGLFVITVSCLFAYIVFMVIKTCTPKVINFYYHRPEDKE